MFYHVITSIRVVFVDAPQPLTSCAWLSSCGHVVVDAIAAAGFEAAGTCPRGCDLGVPVTWRMMPLAVGDVGILEGTPLSLSSLMDDPSNPLADACNAFKRVTDSMELKRAAEQNLRNIAVQYFGSLPALLPEASLHVCSNPPCLAATLLMCSRCERAFYCSVACQVEHKRDHKPICRASVPG